MYLVPIHVPIYLSGESRYLTTEWKRSLLLLRDSFGGFFGDLVVVAPCSELTGAVPAQALERGDGEDGIRLVPSIPYEHRARNYWLKYRRAWMLDCLPEIDKAAVVHSGLDDVFRPMAFHAWEWAARRGKMTVFVQDTDIVRQTQELMARASRWEKPKQWAYGRIFERWVRIGVSRAELSLLKGRSLLDRYGKYARSARDFHDTSYVTEQIVQAEHVRHRTAGLMSRDHVRYVYCGRFVARKGVDDSIRIVAEARRRGASLTLDLIGDGPQRPELERLVEELGLRGPVRFLGSLPYDQALLAKLAEYDALLFTPPAEDTPRMIFDGYAAGLPLVATGIAYVLERSDAENATVVLPRGDVVGGARILADLDQERSRLTELAGKAREAAFYHAADRWYARRAEWTLETYERYRVATR